MHLGIRIGPYEIATSGGADGTREVFRAPDIWLHPDAAVKVSPKDFASDANWLRHLVQEETLSLLNHVCLLTAFPSAVHEDTPYLLEDRTLSEEINCAALPVRKATDYAPPGSITYENLPGLRH